MAFLKDILNHQLNNIKKCNTTGAAVGAISELLIKQATTGIKHGIGTLQSYLKDITTESKKDNELPEVEIAKNLFMEYASNNSMVGSETIDYKGIKFTIKKTEDELCLNLKREQKNVKISSPFENKVHSQLELELKDISEDILNNINWLADYSTMDVDMHRTLYFNKGLDNELSYLADYKKSNGMIKIIYAPNSLTGVRLTYTILANKKREDN